MWGTWFDDGFVKAARPGCTAENELNVEPYLSNPSRSPIDDVEKEPFDGWVA